MLKTLKQSLDHAAMLAIRSEGDATWSVYENGQFVWLSLNDTIQSVMSKAEPNALTFPHQLPLHDHLSLVSTSARVLEIGLGGGTQWRYLRNKMPMMEYIVVEPSRVVRDFFEHYFKLTDQHVDIVQATGDAFLSDFVQKKLDLNEQDCFDLILSDIYHCNYKSNTVTTYNYCELLAQSLADAGVLYINLLPDSPFEVELLKAHLGAVGLSVIFAEKIPQYRNHVVIAVKEGA